MSYEPASPPVREGGNQITAFTFEGVTRNDSENGGCCGSVKEGGRHLVGRVRDAHDRKKVLWDLHSDQPLPDCLPFCTFTPGEFSKQRTLTLSERGSDTQLDIQMEDKFLRQGCCGGWCRAATRAGHYPIEGHCSSELPPRGNESAGTSDRMDIKYKATVPFCCGTIKRELEASTTSGRNFRAHQKLCCSCCPLGWDVFESDGDSDARGKPVFSSNIPCCNCGPVFYRVSVPSKESTPDALAILPQLLVLDHQLDLLLELHRR